MFKELSRLPLVFTLFFSTPVFSETIRAYTTDDPDIADQTVKAYAKASGDQVEYVRLSGGEAVTRLRTEAKNPQVAVWFVGPAIEYASAADAGLFEPYQPKTNFTVPEKYRDKNFRWNGLYLGGIAFASNETILKNVNAKPPTSWEDLLKPEFKGKIGFAYPYTSGTALTILLTVVKLMGEEKAMDYFKKLDQNVHQYTKSGSACINQAGLGELGVCIAFSHDILWKGKEKGYPIEMTFPKEGTGYEISSAAIIKGGPGSEKAKKFIDWLYSEESQKIYEKMHRTPMNPKVPVQAPGIKVTDLKLIDVDPSWASQNQKALIAKWRQATGK